MEYYCGIKNKKMYMCVSYHRTKLICCKIPSSFLYCGNDATIHK